MSDSDSDVLLLTLLLLLRRRRRRRRLLNTEERTENRKHRQPNAQMVNGSSAGKSNAIVLSHASVTNLTPSMLLQANSGPRIIGNRRQKTTAKSLRSGSAMASLAAFNVSDDSLDESSVAVKEERIDPDEAEGDQPTMESVLLQEVSIKEEPFDDWSGGQDDG